MGDIVSRATLTIDCSEGNFDLQRVKSCDVSFEAKLEVQTAVGVEGGAGFREQTGGGELSLDVYRETGKAEINYRGLWARKEIFAWVIQDIGGRREQYRGCRVESPPGRKIDDQGNVMDTVKIKFLQHGEL